MKRKESIISTEEGKGRKKKAKFEVQVKTQKRKKTKEVYYLYGKSQIKVV